MVRLWPCTARLLTSPHQPSHSPIPIPIMTDWGAFPRHGPFHHGVSPFPMPVSSSCGSSRPNPSAVADTRSHSEHEVQRTRTLPLRCRPPRPYHATSSAFPIAPVAAGVDRQVLHPRKPQPMRWGTHRGSGQRTEWRDGPWNRWPCARSRQGDVRASRQAGAARAGRASTGAVVIFR